MRGCGKLRLFVDGVEKYEFEHEGTIALNRRSTVEDAYRDEQSWQ